MFKFPGLQYPMKSDEPRKIVFVSGTRADFGKITSLIQTLEESAFYEVSIFVTGMHLIPDFGSTWKEIDREHQCRIHRFENGQASQSLEKVLAKTVLGLGQFLDEVDPDLLVVHGDRVEALAGAAVGALRGIRVAHIEGGETSGTIDDSMRHAITKLSHFHFTANSEAATKVSALGESKRSIFEIGSPDVDVILGGSLPSLEDALEHYGLPELPYVICIFHPNFFEQDDLTNQASNLVEALNRVAINKILIMPNSDPGYSKIIDVYQRVTGKPDYFMFPSLRFEYFITLLKHSTFIIGNSSASIFEASYLGVPAVNVGTRQSNRARGANVIDCDSSLTSISSAIQHAMQMKVVPSFAHGDGSAAMRFLRVLDSPTFWNVPLDKSRLV